MEGEPMDNNHTASSRIEPTDLVALAILAVGLIRIFISDSILSRLDQITLTYLIAAAVVFLVKRIKLLKYGDFEVELKELKNGLKETKLLAGIAEDTAKIYTPIAPSGKQDTKSFRLKAMSKIKGPEFSKENIDQDGRSLPDGIREYSEDISLDDQSGAEVHPGSEILPGNIPDDPWKGVFGGKSIDKEKGRLLSAQVEELKSSPGWYSVTLSVTSLPKHPPLEGSVRFFIHDTFPNNRPTVYVAGGVAVLRLKAWGAFTVGVLADDGKTKLELDLANLESAPDEFRSR